MTRARNRFHSLCPYFAMFPEQFVETWVERVSRPGMTILDPFCGRGTSPFQAILMGRRAIAVDINPVAYCITKAKTNAPAMSNVLRRLTWLQNRFDERRYQKPMRQLPEFFRFAYAPYTLKQLLFLRSTLGWKSSNTDCMIAALVLGSLHGESQSSPSYLSNQMPRTISTKPKYSVRYWKKHGYTAPERNVFDLVRSRLAYRYESQPAARSAEVYHSDMREIPRLIGQRRTIRAAITSPPYLNVTNCEEDQWLRLWFLGGAPRPTYQAVSRDDRIGAPERYWDFIADMWRMLGIILTPPADVVIRIGGKGLWPDQIVDGLKATSIVAKRRVRFIHQETSEIVNRQTPVFRPGAAGCKFEVDCHCRVQ